jgi:hypothetical protein
MKTTTIIKSVIAAVILCGSATILMSQSGTPACPLGHEPGYGRTLNAEQKAAQCTAVQQLVAELRQKQTSGTITTEEKAWLQKVEQRGGPCVTGTPRAAGTGKGQGTCVGAGQCKRQGLRDGTGPRSADGTCPLGNTPQRAGQR